MSLAQIDQVDAMPPPLVSGAGPLGMDVAEEVGSCRGVVRVRYPRHVNQKHLEDAVRRASRDMGFAVSVRHHGACEMYVSWVGELEKGD